MRHILNFNSKLQQHITWRLNIVCSGNGLKFEGKIESREMDDFPCLTFCFASRKYKSVMKRQIAVVRRSDFCDVIMSNCYPGERKSPYYFSGLWLM